jgi:hypothetical protein
MTVLPSHASDGAAEATWPHRDVGAESCWRRRCWGNLAAVRCRGRVTLAMVLLSHASDDTAGATWPQCDVDVESCWRQCC